MKDKGYFDKSSGLRVRKKQEDEDWWIFTIFQNKEDDRIPKIEYISGPGNRVIRFKGKLIYLQFETGKVMLLGHSR